MSDADMAEYQGYVLEGFKVGSLDIVPARIFLALISFGALVAVNSWLKKSLDRDWLAKTKIDRGTREAIVIIIGYSGFAVAVLVGLGVAGMDFTNLAIVAGALSVGIGFGLQNIVNNFVSGLILLFERPVKRGDWIVVGNTEGYVKRIRIRSTQIETFDHADVIVPNSELISGQVTNWMLTDQYGRARVPVGVAYGSDTDKVKQLLLEVAEEHPMVVTDRENMPPKVLFLRFGNSSLDFELRVFIQNVDNRLNVISDLNFAIDRKFREHGIEIPYPKQDLYIKELPTK
jgi:small-conductance mechanosensitive channel